MDALTGEFQSTSMKNRQKHSYSIFVTAFLAIVIALTCLAVAALMC